MQLLNLIQSIFKPAVELIDNVHTSQEEKLQHKERLLVTQAAVIDQVLQYEKDSFESRAKIIEAEAKSEHWLTAIWRPVTMLTFLALCVGDSLGLLSSPLRDEAWSLLQLGLGGYVVGRSAEKITKSVLSNKEDVR
jgi:hypothetical protein